MWLITLYQFATVVRVLTWRTFNRCVTNATTPNADGNRIKSKSIDDVPGVHHFVGANDMVRVSKVDHVVDANQMMKH
jgi:hypothetical protein